MAPLLRALLLTLLFLFVPGSATAAVVAPCGEVAALSIPAAPDAPDDAEQSLDDARPGRAATGWSRLGRSHRAGAGEATVGFAPLVTRQHGSACRPSRPAAARAVHAVASADTARCARTRAPPPG